VCFQTYVYIVKLCVLSRDIVTLSYVCGMEVSVWSTTYTITDGYLPLYAPCTLAAQCDLGLKEAAPLLCATGGSRDHISIRSAKIDLVCLIGIFGTSPPRQRLRFPLDELTRTKNKCRPIISLPCYISTWLVIFQAALGYTAVTAQVASKEERL
jgi:hypothetical protein